MGVGHVVLERAFFGLKCPPPDLAVRAGERESIGRWWRSGWKEPSRLLPPGSPQLWFSEPRADVGIQVPGYLSSGIIQGAAFPPWHSCAKGARLSPELRPAVP